ncbi:MAG: amino acid ABC transporter permease [Anaerolineales bacterium]|nr:amino acid ABC transporter permease [Chloroflexota bacterium]MBL6983844.1 amino acid ABC transporter permease [Anaerolineales bacterium]
MVPKLGMNMLYEWLTNDIISLLIRGFALTIWLSAATSVLSLIVGVFVGIVKINRDPILSRIASVFIEIHRNVPALVLIIFWAFALPSLFPLEIRKALFFDNNFMRQFEILSGLSIPYYALAAGLAITLNTSAYIAELFRAGVGTIHQEHLEASRTLGASKWIQRWQIVIPQGIRAAFPAISTRLIHNMKNTALAAFVSTPEFFHTIQTAITRSFHAVEMLLIASVVYLIISIAFANFLGWIERRLNRFPARSEA